jgi:membrane-associated phospholipid phosphatase
MIATAMAIAMHSLLKTRFAKGLNIIYPICIALSVSTAFHWISDVFSGALIGLSIGLLARKYPRLNKNTI